MRAGQGRKGTQGSRVASGLIVYPSGLRVWQGGTAKLGNIETAGAWRASGAIKYEPTPRRASEVTTSEAAASNAAAFNPAAREQALAHELESRLSRQIARIRKGMSDYNVMGGTSSDAVGQILDIAA